MTKAEKAATELGYHCDPNNRGEFTANEVRKAAIEGYQQAEEDLSLNLGRYEGTTYNLRNG